MRENTATLLCLCRTWCVGAAMTTRGMQHLGLLYAMDPVLTTLYTDKSALDTARRRYLEHANTHPFMAPLFVGLLIHLERHIAQGRMPAQAMKMLVGTTATTLSALGDSFFSGTLLVTWSLAAVLCVLLGHVLWAAVASAALVALLTVFRVGIFLLGVRHGLAALQWLRQVDLINWGDRFKICNALLLCTILWGVASMHAPALLFGNFFWGILCLIIGALLVNRAHLPRVILAGIVVTALYLGGITPPL